jgi:hypothetical protein
MAITNQITPNGQQPYANQMNFGQLVGRVNGYATHASPSVVQNIINDVVRRVYDRRQWWSNFTKGQLVSSGYYSTGTVSLTLGSTTVTGTGTAFTPSLVGQQFRLGFIAPIYTITAFIDATHLQLEFPWGLQSMSSTGYFISQMYFSFPNIKFFYSMKNLQMIYRMWCNVPQSLLETWDPGRLQVYYPRVLATMPPDASGNAQFELWPAPNVQQAFPWLGYIQPPNLVNDLDNFPPFMRADVIELGSIAQALLYRPKKNENYSENLALEMAHRFNGMFESELLSMASADESLMRQDVLRAEECFPMANMDWTTGAYLGGGGFLAAMSPVTIYEDYF